MAYRTHAGQVPLDRIEAFLNEIELVFQKHGLELDRDRDHDWYVTPLSTPFWFQLHKPGDGTSDIKTGYFISDHYLYAEHDDDAMRQLEATQGIPADRLCHMWGFDTPSDYVMIAVRAYGLAASTAINELRACYVNKKYHAEYMRQRFPKVDELGALTDTWDTHCTDER